MTSVVMPFGGDPSIILACAVVEGVSAAEAGASFITRKSNYLLTVPSTHEAVVRETITAAPTETPAIVPDVVSQTQFMRAASQAGMVTDQEAEDYLARGELPAFVAAPLDALPAEQRADARLKAIGATEFHRSDALFALLIAGGSATAAQVDNLFRLADSLR